MSNKIKWNPEITLGHLIQLGAIVVGAIILTIRMEVREAHQDNKIQQSLDRIEIVEKIDDKQNEALAAITLLVNRLDERSKNAR